MRTCQSSTLIDVRSTPAACALELTGYASGMSLGAHIKAARKAAGLTLEALSELSGVKIGTLSALEVRDSVRSEYAPQIAHALEMTADDLYAGKVPSTFHRSLSGRQKSQLSGTQAHVGNC